MNSTSANVWDPKITVQFDIEDRSATEVFTPIVGLTIFNIVTFAYALDNGSLSVYKNGSRLTKGIDWFEQSTTSFSVAVPSAVDDVYVAIATVGSSVVVEVANIANKSTYDLGTSAALNSHKDIVPGHIIETSYLNSTRVRGSGCQVYYTGSIDVTRAGEWPASNGNFHDAEGKQFKVLGYIKAIYFGFEGAFNTPAAVAAIAATGSRTLYFEDLGTSYDFGAVSVPEGQTWMGRGEVNISGEVDVAGTGVSILGMAGLTFQDAHCFTISTNIDQFTFLDNTISRTSGEFRAINIDNASVLDLIVKRNVFATLTSPAVISEEGEAIYFGIGLNADSSFDITNNVFDGWQSGLHTAAGASTFFSTSNPCIFENNTIVNSTDRGCTFYHTSDCRILNNRWEDNQKGVWIDAALVVNGNTFRGTKNVPTTLAPDDGTVIDITVPADAAAFQIYNGGADLVCAVILYNAAESFSNNKILDNAYDGVAISVDSFKDQFGLIEGNEVLRNGRHGYFISPQPRGDSWGGSRRIYAPVIQGGKISNNVGHAVNVDGRYVEAGGTVSYNEVRGTTILKDCVTYENGAVGWYDEDGIRPCIMKVYNCKDNFDAMLKNVHYDNITQGGSGVTYHGLYLVDDGAGTPANGTNTQVINCDLHRLQSAGLAIRTTRRYGYRNCVNNFLFDITSSVSMGTALGGAMQNRNNWDRSGATN